MPRNVDADKIISHLNDEIELCGHPDLDRNPIAYGTYLGLLSAKSFIETAETADVQEVRHGCWYWYEEPHSFYDDSFECGWKCSCCNNYPDHDNYVADNYENKPELKYCNKCGALMDGKE